MSTGARDERVDGGLIGRRFERIRPAEGQDTARERPARPPAARSFRESTEEIWLTGLGLWPEKIGRAKKYKRPSRADFTERPEKKRAAQPFAGPAEELEALGLLLALPVPRGRPFELAEWRNAVWLEVVEPPVAASQVADLRERFRLGALRAESRLRRFSCPKRSVHIGG